jgi:hypothetical protein
LLARRKIFKEVVRPIKKRKEIGYRFSIALLRYFVRIVFAFGTATIRHAERLQPVDYTCLLLACRELNNTIVPAKFENALQPVRCTAWIFVPNYLDNQPC